MRLDDTSTRINRAVRAEAARQGVDGRTLATKALHRDPKYVYERFRFQKDFSLTDLNAVAEYLGITTEDIFHSAEFDREIHSQVVAA